jgi:hypothetical protein
MLAFPVFHAVLHSQFFMLYDGEEFEFHGWDGVTTWRVHMAKPK